VAEAAAAARAARLAELDTVEVHAAAAKVQLRFRANKLRELFEPPEIKALTRMPAQAMDEAPAVDEREALVEQGLATWLWEKLEADDNGKFYWYNNETGETQWEEPEDENDILPIEAGQSAGATAAWSGGQVPEDIEEWEVCADDQGRTFYYNASTGESQWEAPLAPEPYHAWEVSTSPSASVASSTWEECQDDDGRTFFYNNETGQSSWEDPRRNAEKGTSASDIERKDAHNKSGRGEGRTQEGLDEGDPHWEVAEDDEGNSFYYNPSSGDSTYERLDGALIEAKAVSSADASPRAALNHSEAAVGVITGWELVDDGEGNPFYYNTETGDSSWEKPSM